jgi:hypothetical protein
MSAIFGSVHFQNRDWARRLTIILKPHRARHRRDRSNLIGQVTREAIGHPRPSGSSHDKHASLVDLELCLQSMDHLPNEVSVGHLGTALRIRPNAAAAVRRSSEESCFGGLVIEVDDVFKASCVSW